MSNKKESHDKKQKKPADHSPRFWKRIGGIERVGVIGFCMVLVGGVLAVTGAFSDDPFGTRGSEKTRGLLSRLNPFSSAPAPMPSPPPQLSKSYIYAGSRLLAVEDAGATGSPPADLAIWRPTSGEWWVLGGGQTNSATQGWGTAGDVPLPGDYDGDGKTDFCVYRPSSNQWWILKSSNGAYSAPVFGTTNDIAAPADFDGDGMTDVAVFRPSDGNWYVLKSSDAGLLVLDFGASGDQPAPHDYDGDGMADAAVWRDSDRSFYSANSSNGLLGTATLSGPGLVPPSTNSEPVPGDYDGDGRADYAVRNGNDWIIVNSSTGIADKIPWQQAGDEAVQNDYDGDGRVDIAVWRSGTWFIRNSADLSLRQQVWGIAGDTPVPALYRR